jgi:hypothetical protein
LQPAGSALIVTLRQIAVMAHHVRYLNQSFLKQREINEASSSPSY